MDRDETERLRAEVERLQERVKLLEGETYCAYCGERFPLDAPQGTDLIGGHIRVCVKHPMRATEAEIERLRDQLRAENIVDELTDLCAAVEAERAATVAYIDDWASTLNTRAAHIGPSDVRRIARGIEAGEHKAEKKEG
jgi:hypothetical protein